MLKDLALWLLLCSFTIIAWLLKFILIRGIGFSNTGISFNRSLRHYASLPVTSQAANSLSIVETHYTDPIITNTFKIFEYYLYI